MSKYNATVQWKRNGKVMSTGAAQVENGKILTVAGTSCAPGQDTPAFDAYYRTETIQARLGATLEVLMDGAAVYRAKVARIY